MSKSICFAVLLGASGLFLGAGWEPVAENVRGEADERPWESAETNNTADSHEVSEALQDRAFWGAPPPMPHSFTKEWDDTSCLSCHAVKNNVARRQQAISPIPHGNLSQCQQCHVRVLPGEQGLFRESEFVGLGAPGKGSRATKVSPPTIPHHTFMRENCLSCHGPAGEQRVTTPHPYRSQCQQCHVPQIERQYSRFPLR